MDRADVLALFQHQFGVAEVSQLVELGVAPRTIRRARLEGRLVPVLFGVFKQPGATLTFEARATAVLLHCGRESFLSGATAAALHGFRSMPRSRITVTVRATARISVPAWVQTRRTAWIDADDVTTRPDGLRIASPLRTLFALASEFNEHRFRRAAEDAWHLGLVTPADASNYLARVRRSGREGVTRFEEWLDSVSLRERPSQSGLELDVVDAIRSVGLPEPERQFPLTLLTGELIHLDLAWPAIRLGVEPGHSWWHGGDLKASADAARDRACGELGWQIVRLDESMKNDLAAAARQLRRIYDSRRSSRAAS